MSATLVTPLTVLMFAKVFLGPQLALSPPALALELVLFLFGSALVALTIRRMAGAPWVIRQKPRIDGLAVIALCVFAVALMDGMAVRMLDDPLLVIALTAIAFAIALATMAVTALVFARIGRASSPRSRAIAMIAPSLGSVSPNT